MDNNDQLQEEMAHLKNAASLLLDADGWFSDKKFREQGGLVFYAIDTDVINLFISPKTNSKYADIFQTKDETSQLLAWLLADFIFLGKDGLSIQRPFLLIPPHDEELIRTASALHRKVSKLTGLIDIELDEIVNELSNRISAHEIPSSTLNSYENLAEWLSDNAQYLIELFENRRLGPELELKRLTELSREDAIHPIGQEIIPGLNIPFPQPDIERNIEDADKFFAMKSIWLEHLRKHKPPKKPAYAIDGDAEVLARLEWANDALRHKKIRVALISGANDIHLAAKNHTSRDFSTLYLRRPRSFLAAKEMFAFLHSDDGNVKADLVISEWLNLFFPEAVKRTATAGISSNSMVDRRLLKLLTASKNDIPESFFESLQQLRKVENSTPLRDYVWEWGKHIDNVAAARKVHPKLFPDNKTIAKEIAQLLWKPLSNSNDSGVFVENELYEALYASSVSTLDQLYSAPTWIGLWSTIGKRREKIKGVPELRFDKDKLAQDYADSVIASLPTGNSNNLSLLEVYKELSEFDKSNYLAHVVHALAYASKGHWYATYALCRLAVAVVDCIPQEIRGERQGREACYLAAIAIRRLCESPNTLTDAEKWLNKARERNFDGNDLRFDSETLAIDTTKLFFNYFSSNTNCSSLAPAEAEAIQSRLFKLISQIERGETDEKIRRWLLRQCLTNLFSLKILTNQTNPEQDIGSNDVSERLLQTFDSVTEHRESNSLSRYVYKVAFAIYGQSTQKRVDYANEVIINKPTSSMPFDKKRFDLMADVAKHVAEQLF